MSKSVIIEKNFLPLKKKNKKTIDLRSESIYLLFKHEHKQNSFLSSPDNKAKSLLLSESQEDFNASFVKSELTDVQEPIGLRIESRKKEKASSLFLKTTYFHRKLEDTLRIPVGLGLQIDSSFLDESKTNSYWTSDNSPVAFAQQMDNNRQSSHDNCNFFNNFYQFSFLYGWEDSYSVQLVMSFISATAKLEDVYLKPIKKLTVPFSYNLKKKTVYDYLNRISIRSLENQTGFRLHLGSDIKTTVQDTNSVLNQISFGNTITNPSFSGAGLLQKVMETLSPKFCLLQNLIDLKRLYKKLAELQREIRSYKIIRKIIKKIRLIQTNLKKYIQKKKNITKSSWLSDSC
jgi:hypothetical protein